MNKPRMQHIDMLRGVAALLVCIGHARGFLWVDYPLLQSPSLIDRALYLFTSLGHQAVLIFFALSGFLVGGAAVAQIRSGAWSVGDYALRRMTRLWTVLIPALLLTLAFDVLGRDVLRLTGYGGEWWDLLSSGPAPGAAADNGWQAFLINLAFLQTIAGPTFGTNGPLWSLANEFWYYLFIPLAWYAAVGRGGWLSRSAALVIALLAILLLPQTLVLLGLPWLAGALAWPLTMRVAMMEPAGRRALLIMTSALTAAMLLFSRLSPSLPGDIALGCSCALWLPCLAATAGGGRWYQRASFALSEISYTLYVTHFPILAFFAFMLFLPAQYTPDVRGVGWLIAAVAFSLASAAILWRLFESRTDEIRRGLQSWWKSRLT